MAEHLRAYPAIIGVGAALPDRVVSNAQLIEMTGIDSSPEWIEAHTGIAERRWVEDGEYASGLATRAGTKALAMARVLPDEVANLFLSTATPDYPTPSTSSLVHKNLGLQERCLALDVNAACAGSMIALSLASDRLMAQDHDDPTLVIGSEITSRGLNQDDRSSVILFGDGAGAAVVRNLPGAMKPVSAFMTQPNFIALNVPAGGLVEAQQGPDDPRRRIHMIGKKVALHAYDIMTKAPERVASLAGLFDPNTGIEWDGIDYFVPHQANGVLVDVVAQTLKVPDEKVVKTVRQHGNTSSASI